MIAIPRSILETCKEISKGTRYGTLSKDVFPCPLKQLMSKLLEQKSKNLTDSKNMEFSFLTSNNF
jgi:hypothetical protein